MNRFRSLWLVLLALVSPAAFAGSALPEGVVPFSGSGPALPNDDLRRILDPVIGNSPIVAIGESIHGTAEYTKFQHRVLKYLVEEKGFRIFVLENPLLRNTDLAEAVQKCGADPLPMSGIYFPAEEDLALFEWIRSYNCARPADPIHFRGVDIWDRYWDLQKKIVEYGTALGAPNIAAAGATLKKSCLAHSISSWDQFAGIEAMMRALLAIPTTMYEPCMKTLDSLMAWADAEATKEGSGPRFAQLQRFYQVLSTASANQENLNFRWRDFGSDWNARDKGQARNVYSIWKEYGLNQKVVWISHTSHTSHMRSASDWWKLGMGTFRSAVSFFEEFYKIVPVNIMLTNYHSTGGQGDWADPSSPDSLDLLLHGTGEKFLAFDPKASWIRAKGRWWVQNENYDDPETYRDGVYLVPEDNFDFYFFFDETLKGKAIEPWVSPWEW